MRGTAIRWPILAVAVAGVVVAAGLLAWFLLIHRPQSSFTVLSEPSTILFVGLARSGNDVQVRETVLLHAPSGEGEGVSYLLIPSDVAVKSDDGALTPLRLLYARGGSAEIRDEIVETLRVPVDSIVVLDEEGVVALVDRIGGVPLVVESPVVYAPSEGGETLDVLVGEGRRTGEEVLAYLRGDSDVPATTRQKRVLEGLAAAALDEPTDRAIRQGARALHDRAETDATAAALARLLGTLARTPPAELRIGIMPTEEVFVDGLPVVHPRAVETERLLASLVRGIDLLTPTDIRVAVFNGNGVRMMASRTAEYLRARGFEVTRIANAETFGYDATYVVVLTEEAKAWVLRDALPSRVRIVFPDAFEEHMSALEGLVPFGTDVMLIAGAGLELE